MRADELVRAAMEQTGADGPTALADSIGLPGRQAPRRISRWLAGDNEPDYPATILLLAAAGLLRDEAAASQPVPLRAEAAVEARLARIEKMQEQVLEMLEARADQAARPGRRARKGRA